MRSARQDLLRCGSGTSPWPPVQLGAIRPLYRLRSVLGGICSNVERTPLTPVPAKFEAPMFGYVGLKSMTQPLSLSSAYGRKRSEALGLHPNFPPVISRVRRLFRPLLGRVVCGFGLIFIPVFPAALHSLRAVEKLSGFGSEAGVHCTAPASSWAGQAVRAMAELP